MNKTWNNSKAAIILITTTLAITVYAIWLVIHISSPNQDLFQKTGTIGDTIGGIAGPILNFAGMLVVYLSLKEQLRANQLQADALRHEQEKTDHERLVKSTELAIDSAKREIEDKIKPLKQCFNKINSFDEDLERNTRLGHIDSQEWLIRAIEVENMQLTELAALLYLVYEKIVLVGLPYEYESHCINLFYIECIRPIYNLSISHQTNELITDEIISNLTIIIRVKERFLKHRHSYYKGVNVFADKLGR